MLINWEKLRSECNTPEGAERLFWWICIFPISIILILLLLICIQNFGLGYLIGSYIIYLIVICIIVLIGLVIIARALTYNSEIWFNFRLWLQQIVKPLIMGAIIGMLLIMIYLASVGMRNCIETDNVLATIFGLYISSCGLFIAFWGIFHEKIPILDLLNLMEFLTRDLTRCKKNIFWGFPSLSFGSLSGEGNAYLKLFNALKQKIEDPNIIKNFILLNPEEITEFYKCYKTRLDANPEKVRYGMKEIGMAIYDSINRIEHIRVDDPENMIHKFVKSHFKYQIIIIDDHVYLLNTFGLPIRNNGEYDSSISKEEEIVVEVAATRLHNEAISVFLKKLILREAESKMYADIYKEKKDYIEYVKNVYTYVP